MEIGIISLIISAAVGLLQLFSFLHARAAREEQSHDKFAKADGVTSEINSLKDDIEDIEFKLENHGSKISALQSASAVLISQMQSQIAALEKLSDKLDDLK